MATEPFVIIQYDGLDIGSLYLSDVGRRPQLGGGLQSELGQDDYVSSGETKCLIATENVLQSLESGVLKRYSTDSDADLLNLLIASGSLPKGTTAYDAPLTITQSSSCAGEVTFYGGDAYGTGTYGA